MRSILQHIEIFSYQTCSMDQTLCCLCMVTSLKIHTIQALKNKKHFYTVKHLFATLLPQTGLPGMGGGLVGPVHWESVVD
jgi:hypothetical protein